jgi:hypothetical protein
MRRLEVLKFRVPFERILALRKLAESPPPPPPEKARGSEATTGRTKTNDDDQA